MRVSIVRGEYNEDKNSEGGYIVFGISFGGATEYVLDLERFPSEPSFVDASDCEIMDARVSRYWTLRPPFKHGAYGINANYFLTFSEWASDPAFYENIVNSKGQSGLIWRNYKHLLALEFAPPTLKVTAEKLENQWVQCSRCSDAWEVEFRDEVGVCPNCGLEQLIPLSQADLRR